MKVGDLVLITHSFGSGEDYEGHIGVVTQEGHWINGQITYNYIVRVANEFTFICHCIPTTELLRALY